MNTHRRLGSPGSVASRLIASSFSLAMVSSLAKSICDIIVRLTRETPPARANNAKTLLAAF